MSWAVASVLVASACGSSSSDSNGSLAGGGAGGGSTGGAAMAGGTSGPNAGGGGALTASGGGGGLAPGGAANEDAGQAGVMADAGAAGATSKPFDCAAAGLFRSTVGCEFWPTVTFNPVYSAFDFGVLIANGEDQPASVNVTRAGAASVAAVVAAHSMAQLVLPWVDALKGASFDAHTQGGRPTQSVLVPGGGYRLTSNVPISVWQYSPLNYRKDAAVCPYPPSASNGDGVHCEAVLSDAAQLLPTSALTGNYLFLGKSSFAIGASDGSGVSDSPGVWTLTATQDMTHIALHVAGDVAAGAGVAAAAAGSIVQLSMNAGDVVELLGKPAPFADSANADLSGSVLNADKPIQVVSSVPITTIPSPPSAGSCCGDHLEEVIPPAEGLSNKYVVVPPSTAKATRVGHYVRFVAAQSTSFTYQNGPAGAPLQLQTGEVAEFEAKSAFSVSGSSPFGVMSIMEGGTIQNGCTSPDACYVGDPSMSLVIAPDQFLNRYTIASSGIFAINYADVLAPANAMVLLDGAPLDALPLGGSPEPAVNGWVVFRIDLGKLAALHTLESTRPFGVQLMGFGEYLSYYTPGGQALRLLSAPPVIVR